MIDSSPHMDGLLNHELQQVSVLKENLTIVPKKQPSDTAVITFMLYTALISNEVQRENINEASLLLFTLLLQVETPGTPLTGLLH